MLESTQTLTKSDPCPTDLSIHVHDNNSCEHRKKETMRWMIFTHQQKFLRDLIEKEKFAGKQQGRLPFIHRQILKHHTADENGNHCLKILNFRMKINSTWTLKVKPSSLILRQA